VVVVGGGAFVVVVVVGLGALQFGPGPQIMSGLAPFTNPEAGITNMPAIKKVPQMTIVTSFRKRDMSRPLTRFLFLRAVYMRKLNEQRPKFAPVHMNSMTSDCGASDQGAYFLDTAHRNLECQRWG
jgi:hypothetical protein